LTEYLGKAQKELFVTKTRAKNLQEDLGKAQKELHVAKKQIQDLQMR
jgi:hypothetical protein